MLFPKDSRLKWLKLRVLLPYVSAIPLLGIHTKETRIDRDTCTPMFIAALFTIARTWKQPRCPSASSPFRTPTAGSLKSWDRRVRPRLV